ncbi:hypothetical protein CGLO_02308 [Colletotrichum gloeosporioides Cg-14]|uniref:Uncharacterized protein n=1 Tax=Colletotrichum gloeosporioides (strain Cg-14) TaxID=1237896 RepID=T0M1C9_COLGC|nr:hypothetical protein CGLO_02308 [Colletotrichum gloeosporioides Cg-14]
MATEDLDSRVLSLNLFTDDDDEEDILYKGKLQNLIDGTVTPSEAADDFDAWVVRDANNRLKELLKRPDPKNLTSEEEAKGMSLRAIAPNASGSIDLVFPTIAKLCSAFPPFHPGQDAIVQFLEALRAMPKHQVPDGIPDGDEDDSHLITLWPFGEDWMALTEIFRREADEYSYPYSDIETPGSETQVRWRNFQSAIARITALGLINCGFLSALGDIMPSSSAYPDLEKRKIGGPNRISGDAIAAAQWVMWPDEGRFVFQQCKKLHETGSRAMWSQERWGVWKEQFTIIAGDERFTPKARVAAKLSRKQMIGYEEEDKFV